MPIGDRGYVRKRRELTDALLRRQQAEAAEKLERLSATQRRDAGQRLAVGKPVYNSLETKTALDLQLAHPDRVYLTQVELLSVERPGAAPVPARNLTTNIDPK